MSVAIALRHHVGGVPMGTGRCRRRVLDRAFAGQGCVVELNEQHPPALVHGGDVTPIMDAEVIEPEPDCTHFLDSSSVEQASNAGRRTYSVKDFEWSESGRKSHRSFLAARWPGGETVGD